MAEKKPNEVAAYEPSGAEISKVKSAHDDGQDDNDKAWAEREAAGFAPRYQLSDTRPREVKEAETRKAMGLTPVMDDFVRGMDSELITQGAAVQTTTSADDAEAFNRLRAAPGYSGSTGEIREITVNGVTVRYRAGEEAKLPAAHAEVLRQSMDPLNTAGMRGATRPILDLT